jgi:FkbM family methyltransferase
MLNRIINKVFQRQLNKERYSFETEGEFFSLMTNQYKIYTHDKECINRVYKHIFDRNIYEFYTEKEKPLIIDAGANIGLGVLYWKKLYPNARIIAFEPSRLAYQSLLKNIEANKLTNVVCINKALADTEGTMQFTTNEIISGSLQLQKNLSNNYDVMTTTLKEYLLEEIDFLKIDIEGAEKLIFNDIAENIRNINHVFLEYHSFINENQYLSKYLNLFEENDFRYIIEDEYKRESHFVREKVSLSQDMQLNIWAKKK